MLVDLLKHQCFQCFQASMSKHEGANRITLELSTITYLILYSLHNPHAEISAIKFQL